MAERVQVLCIIKDNRRIIYQRIQYIQGIDSNGSDWKFNQEDAIKHIEKGKYSFYILVDNQEINVLVRRCLYGYKYLKAESDNKKPIALLKLDECL